MLQPCPVVWLVLRGLEHDNSHFTTSSRCTTTIQPITYPATIGEVVKALLHEEGMEIHDTRAVRGWLAAKDSELKLLHIYLVWGCVDLQFKRNTNFTDEFGTFPTPL